MGDQQDRIHVTERYTIMGANARRVAKRAIEQSKSRDPLVRAMALTYGSRVLASFDKDAAKDAFAAAVPAVESAPLERFLYELLFQELVRMGAAANPVAALALFRRGPPPAGEAQIRRQGGFGARLAASSTAAMLVEGLIQHGEFNAALELLRDPICRPRMELLAAMDAPMQRRMLLAAFDGWRGRRQLPEPERPAGESFYHCYAESWQVLQPDEAHAVLDEILRVIHSESDQPMNTRFGGHIEFRHSRAARLFRIWNVVAVLKSPAEVAALCGKYPELKRAAERYPLGVESINAEARLQHARPEAEHQSNAVGIRRDTGALEKLLQEAHYQYLEDMEPGIAHKAPRVFWPSCHAYRLAMYHGGVRSGWYAEPLLDTVPDRDFQILASIDLAVALAGLPFQGGVSVVRNSERQTI